MANQTSVVTAERFSAGLATYQEWIDAIPERPDRFQTHYDEYTPNADDAAAVKALVDAHGVKVLTIGEHWCPDVWRGLPVMSRVADATGMEHRIFFRDQNKDIMSEFLNQGEFESIPTIVFYDRDQRYLGHWIERAVRANEEMVPLREITAGIERDTPAWEEARARYSEETWKLAPNWRHAEVSEIRALIENAVA